MTSRFEDDHIAVKLHNFSPMAGIANLIVEEKHEKVGFYYIWLRFESGDETRIDYDGGNPHQVKFLTFKTTHRMDIVKEIGAKRVRD